jgi:hypothetical protein
MLEVIISNGWMYSLAGFLVRTFQPPEKERVLMENDLDFGKNTPDLLAIYDPDTQLWRTSQASFIEDLDVYSATWPKSGMTRSGKCYQQPPLVHRISEKESSSWPTPVKLYPTPTASEAIHPGQTVHKQGSQLHLAVVVNRNEAISGQLNPQWVEWLMGYPDGWTDLEDLETA